MLFKYVFIKSKYKGLNNITYFINLFIMLFKYDFIKSKHKG